MARERLHGSLSTVEYFTFGFGSMIGVGWLVLMDDWLTRGGPAGGILGFLLGGLLLFPIAHTYGRLVQRIQDAGAEIAYTEGVMAPSISFAAGWTMVLSYAIVCPWEAVATGNLLARVFPALNSYQLYVIGGSPIYAPRLAVGLGLTALIAFVNYRGIKPSGIFQDVMTFGLLATFAIFTLLGFAKGTPANMQPLFPPGQSPWLSIFLVMQIVPYFMTGFESVAKGSEEAKAGFDPRNFTKAIYAALFAGFMFYVLIVAVVTYVYPWPEIVSGHVRTEVAFERTFGSHQIAQLILFGAFLSLLKIFNGNFVAATRMLYAIGRRNLVHPSLGAVHATLWHAGGRDLPDGGPDGGRRDVRRRDSRSGHRSGLAGGGGRLAVGVCRLSPATPRRARRGRNVAGDGVARLCGERGDYPDEGRAVGAGQLHAPRVDRLRRLVELRPDLLAAPPTTNLAEKTGERFFLIAEAPAG